MSLSDEVQGSSNLTDGFIDTFKLKQTIQDFTEELKEEIEAEIKIADKKNKLIARMLKVVILRIDKLNQKHYGKKLLEGGSEDG